MPARCILGWVADPHSQEALATASTSRHFSSVDSDGIEAQTAMVTAGRGMASVGVVALWSLLLGLAVAGCSSPTTGELTGTIGFGGRVPVHLLTEDRVVALRGTKAVAQHPLKVGSPYSFQLPPGWYSIELRGPVTTTWGNAMQVHRGQVTHLNEAMVFHSAVRS